MRRTQTKELHRTLAKLRRGLSALRWRRSSARGWPRWEPPRAGEVAGRSPKITIFASELSFIRETVASAGEDETCVFLHGWFTATGQPVVALASPPSPTAVRRPAHFEEDPAYVQVWSDLLYRLYGMVYLGRVHTHPGLALALPSRQDRASAQSIVRRWAGPQLIEIIMTSGGGEAEPDQQGWSVHPYVYVGRGDQIVLVACQFRVLDAESPIRGDLVATGVMSRMADGHVARGRGSSQLVDGPLGSTDGCQSLEGIERQIRTLPSEVRGGVRVVEKGPVVIVEVPIDRATVKVAYRAPQWSRPVAVLVGPAGGETIDITDEVVGQSRAHHLCDVFARAGEVACSQGLTAGEDRTRPVMGSRRSSQAISSAGPSSPAIDNGGVTSHRGGPSQKDSTHPGMHQPERERHNRGGAHCE